MSNVQSAENVYIQSLIVSSYNGKQFDITDVFVDFVMKEDMFTPTINGSVTVIDDNEHYEHLPIEGQERLFMKLETLEDLYDFEFYIYKISNIEKENQRTSSYTLHFVSVEEMINESTRVRRSFGNMRYSSMVESILKTEINTKKRVTVARTLNDYTYIPPNTHPFETIRNLCNKSVSEESEQSNYVFFEDRRGFLCGPITEFASVGPKFKYRMNEYVGEENPNTVIPFTDPLSILKFSVKKQTDTLEMANEGIFSSRLQDIDILTRTIRNVDYNYFDEFKDRKHLNKFPIFQDLIRYEPNGNPFYAWSNEFSTQNEYIRQREGNMNVELTSQVALRRRLQLQSYNNNIFSITIPGNIFLFVGDVIDIDMKIVINNELRRHRTLSGNTLITSITHVITRGGKYYQRLETSKDSNIARLEVNL